MSEAKFKTMRHIETVRNYLNLCVMMLLIKGQNHDQSKMQSPEVEIFEEYTHKLRGMTYESEEYKKCCAEMKPALDHHYANNKHHPDCFPDGVNGMTLLDLIEMICDWKAATLRHADGDIFKSLEINSKKYNIEPQLKQILLNTIIEIDDAPVEHHADES